MKLVSSDKTTEYYQADRARFERMERKLEMIAQALAAITRILETMADRK